MAHEAQPETAIRELLLGSAAVVALIGTSRIRPFMVAGGDAMPYLTYQRITSGPVHHLTGHAGFASALVQVNGYSRSKATLRELREECRLALDTKSAVTVTVSGDTVQIRTIVLQDDRDDNAPPPDGSDEAVYGFQQDWLVWFREADPFP